MKQTLTKSIPKLPNALEESLNGGFKGLYGEVVTCDTYKLKGLKFKPDVVFDIGANVGIFSRFARELFPSALIVALEPDADNIAVFERHTDDPNLVLLKGALSYSVTSSVFRGLTAANGSGATYLSPGLGYSEAGMSGNKDVELCKVRVFELRQVILPFWKPGDTALVKIDCEGAENCLWHNKATMDLLRQMDYIALEIHNYALTAQEHVVVVEETQKALDSFKPTHTCERDGVHFWATKK